MVSATCHVWYRTQRWGATRTVEAVFPSAATFTICNSVSTKCWISPCIWQHLRLADKVWAFDTWCLSRQQVSLGCDPKNLGHEAWWMWSGSKCGWNAKGGFAGADPETISECVPEGSSDGWKEMCKLWRSMSVWLYSLTLTDVTMVCFFVPFLWKLQNDLRNAKPLQPRLVALEEDPRVPNCHPFQFY